ncbi:uncharacterized protein [Salminus brasiliensis]|uniref:uncharacterized protein n=1 Tax=Salminus brasiliensis TaxID=930266 RepID=UPI003B8324DD
MSQGLLLVCLFSFKIVLSSIIQSPGLVTVPLGGTAILKCELVDLMTRCNAVSWLKLHPRTKQLNATTVVNTEEESKRRCLGVIRNATLSDSGTYHCAAAYTVMLYVGNGSRVIVTEPSRQPTIVLLLPEESAVPNVFLQCLVMGITPSEVHVSWVIRQTVLTGWTESGWTNDSDSALEFTRAHITVPAERRMDDIECVVELDGQIFSKKSLKTVTDQICFLSLGFSAVFVIVIVTIVIAVSTHIAKQKSVTVRSDGLESHFRHQNVSGKRRTYTVEDSCITEVQYASLDLTETGQRSRTTLCC